MSRKEKSIELLNKAVADELLAVHQYMYFHDSTWRRVELPHDFVIESTPYEYSVQEFGSDNAIPEMDTVRNIHTTAGSFKKDVGWYRKHFFVDASDLGRRIYIAFDGVYRDSIVYVNNFFVGRHQSGYTPFEYDISDFLNYGGDNVIVVYVDAGKAEGWFYEGGGIYRNVWLYKTAHKFPNFQFSILNLLY